MKERKRDILTIILIMCVAFVLSFCDFNGINFVFSFPFLLTMFFYDYRYFFYGYLGMFLSSFFVGNFLLTIILLVAFIVFYLITPMFRNVKMSLAKLAAPVCAGFGFILTSLIYLILGTDPMNVIFIPGIMYLLGYLMVKLEFSLKLKDQFSFTKIELAFLMFILQVVISKMDLVILNFDISMTLSIILNYILVIVDPVIAASSYFASLIFDFNFFFDYHVLFFIIPFIFAFKQFYLRRLYRPVFYLIANGVLTIYFRDYGQIIEMMVVSFSMLVIPDILFDKIGKYVVEIRDYELRLFQQSYYRAMAKNKNVTRIMDLLKEQIELNPRMKKTMKDIILEDIDFLNKKLVESEDIHLKKTIINNINNKGMWVTSLKIENDYLNNYKVVVEVRSDDIDVERIIQILETKLEIKLKNTKNYFNHFTNCCRLVLETEDDYVFKFDVRQRSKYKEVCGDSYLNFKTKNKKYFLVSDGMGSGARASKDSSFALFLLKSLIELGMSVEKAISSCNVLLLKKGDEKFNTLDLLEYDSLNNRLFLYKNGSGVTYLKHDDGITKINSENLPLGIVENIKVTRKEVPVKEGMIVLTSDGFKDDLSEVISNYNENDNQGLIDKIISLQDNIIEDDQTLMVINIEKN